LYSKSPILGTATNCSFIPMSRSFADHQRWLKSLPSSYQCRFAHT